MATPACSFMEHTLDVEGVRIDGHAGKDAFPPGCAAYCRLASGTSSVSTTPDAG